MIVDDVLV
jgi:transposase